MLLLLLLLLRSHVLLRLLLCLLPMLLLLHVVAPMVAMLQCTVLRCLCRILLSFMGVNKLQLPHRHLPCLWLPLLQGQRKPAVRQLLRALLVLYILSCLQPRLLGLRPVPIRCC